MYLSGHISNNCPTTLREKTMPPDILRLSNQKKSKFRKVEIPFDKQKCGGDSTPENVTCIRPLTAAMLL